MNNQEFYIGWMPKAPASFAKQVKRTLFVLFPLALIAGLLLASFQKRFSTARFEFGKATLVKGIYIAMPVPMLRVTGGKDIWGNASYVSIPLVGYGKHGAKTAIAELEKEKNTLFNNKELAIKGTLLYSDGKILLQVNKDEDPVVSVNDEAHASLGGGTDLGIQHIRGEIVDPKCYFGVMKPGEGKVHRDCAVRCILGGIPPVLKVMDEKGRLNYCLIVGPAGEEMNEAVQDYVAEPVELEGRLVRQDDWYLLYVKDKKIQRVSAISLYRSQEEIASCISSCMK